MGNGCYACAVAVRARLKLRTANKVLNNMSMAPIKNGAPGKTTGALLPVNQANKVVMSGGPTIEVTLIKLVKPPCSSPCSFGGIWLLMRPCMAGPAIPPRQ
jgi:hypothetical protein